MPGTVKIWWHDGSTLDARNHPTPMINEPERAFEVLTVGAAPVVSNSAPDECFVAVLESDIDVRYRVLPEDAEGNADDPEAKPLKATGFRVVTISVQPGWRLSVREVSA